MITYLSLSDDLLATVNNMSTCVQVSSLPKCKNPEAVALGPTPLSAVHVTLTLVLLPTVPLIIFTVSPDTSNASTPDCVMLAVTLGWGFPLTTDIVEQLYVILVPAG